MKEYPNFYENVKEAEMRLVQTIVMYDGEPYFVVAVCDHKPDGIIRIYLDRLGHPSGLLTFQRYTVPYDYYPPDLRGQEMDRFLDSCKEDDMCIIRKQMDSPKFNKFRPFPLGMCNVNGTATYIERAPVRHTQQGLTSSMLNFYPVSTSPKTNKRGASSAASVPIFTGIEFYRTIMGEYPTAQECLKAMKNPEIGGGNSAVAFHRHFAFVRGPMDTLFLSYKSDVIGYLPNEDFSTLKLNAQSAHTKEVVELLRLFGEIRT